MPESGLNIGGWIFIIFAGGSILFFTVYCFYKVLRTQSKTEVKQEEVIG